MGQIKDITKRIKKGDDSKLAPLTLWRNALRLKVKEDDKPEAAMDEADAFEGIRGGGQGQGGAGNVSSFAAKFAGKSGESVCFLKIAPFNPLNPHPQPPEHPHPTIPSPQSPPSDAWPRLGAT